MKKVRPFQLRLPLSFAALITAWALAPMAAEAQMSMVSLKFQSDTYQVMNRADYPGGNFEIQYLPKGEDKVQWTHMLTITKHGDKSMKDMALSQAREIQRRTGVDRYSGALLMESKSKQSIFFDMIKSEDHYVENSLVRFFQTNDGVYSYKLSRRMYRGRLPADATMSNLEIMKFIDRLRLKRADLIIDFARKTLPYQNADDPMGMSELPFAEKKTTPTN